MTRDELRLPASTTFVMGAKAGRFCSAVIAAMIPDTLEIFIVDEIPNYHYVGDGEIELIGLTTTQWAELVVEHWRAFAPKKVAAAWVDEGDKFEKAIKRSKLVFMKNRRRTPQMRTEVSREYFNTKRIAFVPWLNVLPLELSKAKWPDENSGNGNDRLEGQDYTLSSLEHVLSRRPLPRRVKTVRKSTFLQNYYAQHKQPPAKRDVHLGGQ